MADVKISALTAATSLSDDDLLLAIDDPSGTPTPKKITWANAKTSVPDMVGDSGAGGTRGLVPAPGVGDAANFLKGDGTWAAVAGGGGGGGDFSSNTSTSVDGEIVLMSGTSGKLGKRATGTGVAVVSSGVLSTKTNPTGAFVGTSDTQTLTNKTLTSPTLTTPTIASFTGANHDHTNSAGGGTLTSAAISNFDTQVRTSTLNQMGIPTADLDLNGVQLTNAADPTSDQALATKAYVDALAQGLQPKESVRVVITANVNTSSCSTNQDGVTLVQDDRVLLTGQSTASQNGIYTVGLVTTGTAPLTRAVDANTSAEVRAGMYCWVQEGTSYADTGWILTTNNPITLGSTSLAFTQFSGAGQITAGAGLTKTGNTLDIGAGTGITVNANEIQISSGYTGQSSITTVGTVGSGTWNATTVAPTYGGTGLTTYTTGDVLYASAPNTLSKLPAGSDGQVLTLDSGAPSWASSGVSAADLAAVKNAPTLHGPGTLFGATQIFANGDSINGNTDIYTVPSGKRAFVHNVNYINTSGATRNTKLKIVIGGTEYQWMTNDSLTIGDGATRGINGSIILEAGDVLRGNSNGTGMKITASIVEFPDTSPLKSARLTSFSSGNNTLYTVPAGKSAAFIPGLQTMQLSTTVADGGVFTVTSGTTINYYSMVVPSGGTASTTWKLGSTGTLTGPTSGAALSIPFSMGAGDFYVVNVSTTGAGMLAQIHIWESTN